MSPGVEQPTEPVPGRRSILSDLEARRSELSARQAICAGAVNELRHAVRAARARGNDATSISAALSDMAIELGDIRRALATVSRELRRLRANVDMDRSSPPPGVWRSPDGAARGGA